MAERQMVCSYWPKGGKYGKCPDPQPSDPNAAFFEDMSADSKRAIETCKVCGYNIVAHDPEVMMTRVPGNRRTVVESGKCTGFEPHGEYEYDKFFCGCWGWD